MSIGSDDEWKSFYYCCQYLDSVVLWVKENFHLQANIAPNCQGIKLPFFLCFWHQNNHGCNKL